MKRHGYDKYPHIQVNSEREDCSCGWEAIAKRLGVTIARSEALVCVECYPGVFEGDIERALREYFPQAEIVRTRDYLKSPSEIESMLRPDLTDDPVFFGRLTTFKGD